MAAPDTFEPKTTVSRMEIQVATGPDMEPPVQSGQAPKMTVYRDNLLELAHLEKSQLLQEVDSQVTAGQFALLSLGLALGLFISMLDTSIVSTSLFAIAIEFNSFDTVNWVVLSYTLCYLGFAVFFTQLADIYGRRNAFLGAFVMFSSFSIGCGCAKTLNQLIVFRALQGVGGSGLYCLSMVILPEVTPMRWMQAIGGLCGGVLAVSGVLGPVLGGVLTYNATWRWIFWINVPIGIVASIVFYRAWPKPGQIIEVERVGWLEVDFAGSALLIASSVLTVFSIQHAGSDASQWTKAVFLVPFLGGVACLAAFFVWERIFVRRWPMKAALWPRALTGNRIYIGGLLSTALASFPFFTVVFALPLRFQLVNHDSSAMAAILLLPLLGASALGSVFGAGASRTTDRVFETILLAGALIVLGCGLLTTLAPVQALEAKGLGFSVIVGFGVGLLNAGGIMLVAFEAPVETRAVAQGILAQMRMFGGSIGIAVSTAVLSKSVADELSRIPGGSGSGFASGAGSIVLNPDEGLKNMPEAMAALLREIYAKAFKTDMWLSAVMAAVGILCTLPIYRKTRRTIDQIREEQVTREIQRRRAKTG